MTRCADCLRWEAAGATINYCTICKNDGRHATPSGHQWTVTVPVACVPDDQPETYDARRKRIAAERNQGAVWRITDMPSGDLLKAIKRYKDALAHHQTDGIARAVGNLNQHEPRCGSSRWQP
jgi:hypothetical protein